MVGMGAVLLDAARFPQTSFALDSLDGGEWGTSDALGSFHYPLEIDKRRTIIAWTNSFLWGFISVCGSFSLIIEFCKQPQCPRKPWDI